MKNSPNSASDLRLELLREVAQDLRYLLDRGYHKEPAIKFLGDRWTLRASEREVLKRAVFPPQEAERRRLKLVPPSEVSRKILFVDGHNVIITVESGLVGQPVFLADDGLVRDVRRLSRRFRFSETVLKVLETVFRILEEIQPEEVVFFLDRPLPKSGELAALVRRLFEEKEIRGRTELQSAADKALKGGVPLLASADAPLVDQADRVFDLAAEALKRLGITPFSL